jgi:hypothetical protein
MSLAQQITHGAMVAVKRLGVAIPEIGVARGQLDNIYDFQFGMCTNTFDGVLDLNDRFDSDLQRLGPRILDIKNRGGRTAEDSLHVEMRRGNRARGGRLLEMRGQIALDANKPIKPGKDVFPPGAKRFDGQAGGVQNVGGQSKGYSLGATHKDQTADYVQMATRWSKAALELGLSNIFISTWTAWETSVKSLVRVAIMRTTSRRANFGMYSATGKDFSGVSFSTMATPLVVKRLLSNLPGLPSGRLTTQPRTAQGVGKPSIERYGDIIVEDAAKFFATRAALKRSGLLGP